MLAFAPLGQAGLAYGIYAGLASALLGSAIGAFKGKAPIQFGGPRSSTALIIAGSLLGFLQITDNHTELMLLLAIEISLAGVLIALAQQQGVGKLMQFLPAPVLIGMNTTLGLFSTFKLLPAIVGFAVYISIAEAIADPDSFSILALGVSAIAIAVLVYFRAVRPNPLGLIYGLAVGFGLHAILWWVWPGNLPVQTVGTLPAHPFFNGNHDHIAAAVQQIPGLLLGRPELLLQVLVGSSVLALLVVLESMQSLLQVDQTLGTRHNTRHELNVLAFANVVCGLCLALPSSNYFSRSNTALAVGAKTRRSETSYACFIAGLLAVTWLVFEDLPLHILATAVAISSLFLIQGSTLRLIKRFIRPSQRKRMAPSDRFTVWVVLSMLLVTGLSNLLVGTLVGVLFVAAYFLQQQSSSGLRSVEFWPAARSRSMRPRAQRQHLHEAFEHLAWVRFEGNLFFGNAPWIAIHLQDELVGAQSIVLDFTHLCYVDDTACACIERLMRNAPSGLKIVAVLPASPNQTLGGENLLREVLEHADLSIQTHIDDAFWWMENQLLSNAALDAPPHNDEQALIQSHLCDDMSAQQTERFSKLLEQRSLRSGQELFTEGDQPCGLYILIRGQLSAWQNTGNSNERLMRFCPGSLVGEMALIDNKPRSATVLADTACDLLFLPARHFEELRHEHAELGRIMLNNLARELALRIRLANQSLSLMQ